MDRAIQSISQKLSWSKRFSLEFCLGQNLLWAVSPHRDEDRKLFVHCVCFDSHGKKKVCLVCNDQCLALGPAMECKLNIGHCDFLENYKH